VFLCRFIHGWSDYVEIICENQGNV
jgi:hypothetical protein